MEDLSLDVHPYKVSMKDLPVEVVLDLSDLPDGRAAFPYVLANLLAEIRDKSPYPHGTLAVAVEPIDGSAFKYRVIIRKADQTRPEVKGWSA